ncbi:DHHW family protein [Paenibacillus sp. CF384]|uniref:DHHW family protein n=1 Tax=Paenibacillus sp. CF384 TaxID=1884382 RepID=UPI0008995C13|nr:DHHW family protein [Paenibacillus sp. CF384]SDW10447.1 DHHW protein [Paenibacillus sp. CF384]
MKLKLKLLIALNATLFVLMLLGIGTVNLFASPSADKSELEQRDLALKPAFSWARLFAGEYTHEMDQYFADHFAFRSTLLQAGAGLKGLKGLPDKGGATIVEQGGDNTAAGSSVTGSDSVKYLILGDRAITLFNYSAEAANRYAKALNRFKASVDPHVHVYSMLAPSSAAFLGDSKYRDMTDSQQDAFAVIDSQLNKGITPVDAYAALKQHRSEYIYFRTDHHWTSLGAYYAYSELMKKMDVKPRPLNTYKKGSIENFLGSSYKATLSAKLRVHPDTIDYYDPQVEYSYKALTTKEKSVSRHVVDPHYAAAGNGFYAVFLGGDFPLGEITTKHKNGKKLVVVKDSYANALIPYLLPHFEEIDIIDPRYYKGSITAYVKEHRITDVLLLSSSTAARTTHVAELLEDKISK